MNKIKNVKINKCLNSTELIAYVDGPIQIQKREQTDQHLEQCEKCRRNLRFLTKIDKALAMKKTEHTLMTQNFETCLSDQQIYRYLDNNLDEHDTKKIEKHLSLCASCAKEIATLKNNLFSPMTAFEKEEIAKFKTGTAEEQIAKIISIVEKVNPRPSVEKKGVIIFLIELWDKLKSLIPGSSMFSQKLQFGVAVASIFIVFFSLIGFGKYKTWKSNIFVKNGLSLMTERFVINSDEAPRPSGGFQYSALGITRSGNNSEEERELQSIFNDALHLNQKNANAHQYLGTYYLVVENNVERAEEQYLSVLFKDSTNVLVLNDLGMLYMRTNDYESAERYFQSALNYDPLYLESQYNIALLYEKRQQYEKAREAWIAYLKLDSESKWAIIAGERLERLN